MIVLVELSFSSLPSISWKASAKWQDIVDVGTLGTRKIVLVELRFSLLLSISKVGSRASPQVVLLASKATTIWRSIVDVGAE